MDAIKLHEYIWKDIRKEVYPDKIELHIPFCFGNGNATPLCLTWGRNGVLSDGGRTIRELEDRVGNIGPYMDAIHAILARCGGCKLVGGRIIVKEHFQTVISDNAQYLDYLGGMNCMLKAIAQISIIEKIQTDKDGTVMV